jgi:precorrin-6B methylase 2
MVDSHRAFGVFIGVAFLLLAGWTIADEKGYQPKLGQKGRDIIWLPTSPEVVQKMLDVAKLTPSDFLMDLGSGDGCIVIAAAKRGVRAVGIEYDPGLVAFSKGEAEKAGVSDKATFVTADLFATDFSKATVITMYLHPRLNMRLRPRLLDLKPGTRVVSHNFDMEDWKPDQVESYKERRFGYEIQTQSPRSTSMDLENMANNQIEPFYEHRALLWIVPAKVAGVWTWPGGELTLSQKFQKIKGTLMVGGKKMPLRSAKLTGGQISFEVGAGAGAIAYIGRVKGNTIEGVTRAGDGPENRWIASRRAPQ